VLHSGLRLLDQGHHQILGLGDVRGFPDLQLGEDPRVPSVLSDGPMLSP